MLADINITVEQDLKDQAESVLSEIGLTVSEAVKYFLRATVDLKRLPREIEESNFDEEMLAAMQETEDILSGKIPAKRYTSVKEMLADIVAEDEDHA